jgi:hypothetical protein
MSERILFAVIGIYCTFGATLASAACYPGLGDCNSFPQPHNPQQPRDPVKYYYVGPVFPPDPWLALRSEPSSNAGRQIMKMPEGTLFRLLDTRGDWYRVQLKDGQKEIGWAHRHWIKCCRYLDE